ncbi:S1 RNA-binding domain-containing protein [Lactococcus lactis]
MIHISEIQSGYVKSIHDIAKIGQKVMAQIIDIDEYNGKISLSIRSLEKIRKFTIFTEKTFY